LSISESPTMRPELLSMNSTESLSADTPLVARSMSTGPPRFGMWGVFSFA
jgi:hypothetical protein